MAANTGEFTADKQQAFGIILSWHIHITEKVQKKWLFKRWLFKQEYIFIDLYAGPGQYNDENYTGDGSPVIAKKILQSKSIPYSLELFNNDAEECENLRRLLPSASVHEGNNSCLIDRLSCHENQFGLAYFDPNNVQFDSELGTKIVKCLPKVDLLFYLSAGTEKRVRKRWNRPPGEGWSLKEKMKRVGKYKWFVYRPYGGKFQYSFLLGTNAENISGWEKIGWYDVDSGNGQSILNILNWTDDERKNGGSLQLGFDFGG